MIEATEGDEPQRESRRRRSSDWAVARGLATVRRRFVESWEALPEGVGRRWLLRGALGWVLGAALVIGMTLGLMPLVPEGQQALAFEQDVLTWLEGSFFSLRMAVWTQAPGNAIIMWPLMIAAGCMLAFSRRPLWALACFPGYAMVEPMVALGWVVWDRNRPGLFDQPSTQDGLFNAFPSGHVAHTAYGLGVLFALWWVASRSRGERVLLVALYGVLLTGIAGARLRLGAHWPTDVIAGAVVGLFWLAVQLTGLRRAGVWRR